MNSTPLVGPISTADALSLKAAGPREVDVDDFLNLLIAQLQNQDPLDPTDNAQILEQISQIRSIQTTTRLDQTLQSVLLGQNLSSASGLIARSIRGLADDGTEVAGRVDRVAVEEGLVRLVVGSQSLALGNVREILSEDAAGE